jgi:4-hydroxyphenylpyruvate dioxygenase
MMATTALHHDRPGRPAAPPVIGGIDHVEWWVGNARAFAGLLISSFGFEEVAYAGPETGRRDRVSHLLQQGRIRFIVTGALGPDSPIAEHVRLHGDGVKDVCFVVDDAEAAFAAAIARGALPEREPQVDTDELGAIHHAAIRTYGETVHTFLDRSAYTGPFAPQFGAPVLPAPAGEPVGLTRFDHIVGNVELGRLDEWVEYYRDVLGFDLLVHFGDDQISTEYSALMSTVVWNHDKVVLPINEPAEGRRKSQIEEYLDYYRSPGVQHLALHTPDIVHAVRAMRDKGVRFLDVPPEYYDDARERMAGIDLPWPELADLGIMVDRDDEGYLLQIFTETICDRPTVFFEIIQREGATGFGAGNFKALFEAIERAQAARGNL